MTRRRRWAVVAAVAALVVIAPVAVALVPAGADAVGAATLRQRIAASDDLGWSGDVRTQGTLQIPDTDSFGSVARLLGEENRARVWWRDDEHWRVDRIRQTGETDLFRAGDQTVQWVFESNRATVTPYSPVRLPDTSDLLPPQLAERLLAGARDDELTRIDARRVAGRSAAGLRLTPSGDQTTIGRVDVWADDETGLPLRVEVTPERSSRPILTTRVTRLDLDRPSGDDVAFDASQGIRIRERDAIDVAAGSNLFAPFVLPDTVAGLARRGDPDALGAVGVYGRGPTAIVAVPLRRGLAGRVRDQLSTAATAEQTDAGTALTVGPLSVLLTPGQRGRGTFLVAGTVTPETLVRAADDLATQVRFR